MSIETELLTHAARLNVYSSNGRRAPHKPLLLLTAVKAMQEGLPVVLPWREWDTRLGPLLIEYSPSHRSNTHYPFRRLIGDGLWVVQDVDLDDDQVMVKSGQDIRDFRRTALAEIDPRAGIPKMMAERLRDSSELQAQLVRLLLQVHFPPTLWQDLLDDVGLEHDLTAIVGFPSEVLGQLPVRTRRRSPTFAAEVLSADSGCCLVCHFDGRENTGQMCRPVGLDAAHVKWWTHRGPDDPSNGLTLCALHHRLFDRGMIGFDPDSRLLRQSVLLRHQFQTFDPARDTRPRQA
jgi:putative restriction endonuclease